MKRYWLFFGSDYYPNGGMSDFRDSFDTQEEAVHCVLQKFDTGFEWFHVYDSQEGVIVQANRTSAEYRDRYNTDVDNRYPGLKNQGEIS